MAEYTDLSSVIIDGYAESSSQGRMLGSFEEMPEATENHLGSIVLYIGTSDDNYESGTFYTCVSVSEGYAWNPVTISGTEEETYDADMVIVSDESGLPKASDVSATELGYLKGVTSPIQTQFSDMDAEIDEKQNTITGAATTVTDTNLSPDLVLVSDENGKIAASTVSLEKLKELVETVDVTGIEITGDTREGDIGDTLTFSATVTPDNASNPAVAWSITGGATIESSNTTSCTVRLTAAGTATLTASALDGSGVTATVEITITDSTVLITSIAISGDSAGETGNYISLSASVTPDDATTKAVNWSVTSGSNLVITTQDDLSCTVYCQSAGTGTITATARDGSGISQTHDITVTDPVVLVTGITISGETSGDVGGSITLTASVTPSNADNPAVTWAVTSGTGVASISSQTDSSCVVSLDAEGTAVITATAADGSGISQTHTISVSTPVVPVTGITIDGATEGDLGTYVTLTASVTPDDATNKAVSWEVISGSGYIAITSQTESSCTVYCQAEGTGTVRATAQDGSGIYADHQVTAVDPTVYVTGITISGDTEGTVGDSIVLTATVTPSNATYSSVNWAITSGSNFATISGTTATTCTVNLNSAGTVVITATATDSSDVSDTHTITVKEPYGGTFQLVLDSSTMTTDPTGCFTYAGDCAGWTPVSNTATSLATATTEGSWAFDEDTGFDPQGLFYATFQSGSSGQYLHQLLNPYDLSRYIAIWDDDEKEWEYGSGSSSITSENTMLITPTIYRLGAEGYLIHSNTEFTGASARAHTIDNVTYGYEALGVYPVTVQSSVAMSISGASATVSTTPANFRTYAANNTVRNGWAGIWNFHQWELWKEQVYMRIKSFNGQAQCGNGGQSYSSRTTGLCDALGPFAGDVSGTSNAVKCLIENGWGHLYQFVDDVYYISGGMAVGQNSSPTSDTSNKETVTYTGGGFGSAIKQTDVGWSLTTAVSGSSTTGTCDYVYSLNSSLPFLLVGASSYNVSSGNAGPGCVAYWAGDTSTSRGARLAFCFNA